MEILLSNEQIISELNNYEFPNLINVDIWDANEYEIELVISVTKDDRYKMGNHKIIKVCTERSDGYGDIPGLKKYGQRLTRLIRRRFPDSEVHSDLRYK